MHPYVSHIVAREIVADYIREAEAQRMNRGVRPEDGRRNKFKRRRSRIANRVVGQWARS
jgi:hypothetical protein